MPSTLKQIILPWWRPKLEKYIAVPHHRPLSLYTKLEGPKFTIAKLNFYFPGYTIGGFQGPLDFMDTALGLCVKWPFRLTLLNRFKYTKIQNFIVKHIPTPKRKARRKQEQQGSVTEDSPKAHCGQWGSPTKEAPNLICFPNKMPHVSLPESDNLDP